MVGPAPRGWHIAQMNVARALYDTDDNRMAGFMDSLDRINALAEESSGFVWRLKDESGNATNMKLTDDPRFIVNMSVWETVEALYDFAYKSAHTPFIGRRHDWFEKPSEPIQVLWWIRSDSAPPDPATGLERLTELRENGPGPKAFTFKQPFDPPDSNAADNDAA